MIIHNSLDIDHSSVHQFIEPFLLNPPRVPALGLDLNLSLKLGLEHRFGVLKSGSLFSDPPASLLGLSVLKLNFFGNVFVPSLLEQECELLVSRYCNDLFTWESQHPSGRHKTGPP